MNNISTTQAQFALVECLGNESPSVVEIGEYNAPSIIHRLEVLHSEKRITNESSFSTAMNYLKSLLDF